MAQERDRNRYAGSCVDCGTEVAAQQGRLYRYSGANLNAMNYGGKRRVKRARAARYAYAVRCEACYLTHDQPAPAPVEHSGVTYTGYGQNTHAPCGN